ncbi:MotA/TolQ/ExbB proton channel family protein [Rubripirellula reticaptiva]|uniref:MotA/TolQ/ExbB proton channel domain-containing protein n=1 Tax=Rubripirellula reticaptiva TaxID=2528013 RepID=A0A5C6EM77_9BACT|nr:MotA/TolQ/ExbB proton channel family protein [Rubripirellula reticaptiva]TWU49500.1 hypothetical protein Poly59_41150 [Rubripirellula reticaptiva]
MKSSANPFADIRQWFAMVLGFSLAACLGIATGQTGFVMTVEIIAVGLILLHRAGGYLRKLMDERRECYRDFCHAKEKGIKSLWDSAAAAQPSLFFKLTKFAYRNGTGNTEAVSAWLRYRRTELNGPLYVSRSSCSLLFNLGMIGTVFGLTITFAAISSGMSDTSDIVAVTESLQSALAGLATAFMTTLAGAFFGGVLVSRVNLITGRYLNEFLAILELWLRSTDFDNPNEEGK